MAAFAQNGRGAGSRSATLPTFLLLLLLLLLILLLFRLCRCCWLPGVLLCTQLLQLVLEMGVHRGPLADVVAPLSCPARLPTLCSHLSIVDGIHPARLKPGHWPGMCRPSTVELVQVDGEEGTVPGRACSISASWTKTPAHCRSRPSTAPPTPIIGPTQGTGTGQLTWSRSSRHTILSTTSGAQPLIWSSRPSSLAWSPRAGQ